MTKINKVVKLTARLIAFWSCLLLGVEAAAGHCVDGVQASGALSRICVPPSWNGDLVIYAHGYVAPNQPLSIADPVREGAALSETFNNLNYAFATTSYRRNGWAVKTGVADLLELAASFTAAYSRPRAIYLFGESEGGLIAALAVEQAPEMFSGGLCACAPLGDFQAQLDHFGDFRVVFDYFFPEVLPASAVRIPQEVLDNWDDVYAPRIRKAVQSDPQAARQLLRVTRTPSDAGRPASVETTVLSLLWFNVFTANDTVAVLGGQPFDNLSRTYSGSDDDLRLNNEVQRFSADPAALAEIQEYYQTSGRLASHLVTLHNTDDPIAPYWHQPRYFWKALTNWSFQRLVPLPVMRYGHCNFTVQELLGSFTTLVIRVNR